MMRKLVFTFFLLWVGSRLFSQSLCTMKEYTLLDGYSHGSVNQMLQDSHGIIWIATPDGLSCFDGYTFRNFKSYPGDGVSMGTTNISSICLNSCENIWCLNQDGQAYFFDTRKEHFSDPLKETGYDALNSTGKVSEITELKNGATWITCENGTCFRIIDSVANFNKAITRYQFNGHRIRRIMLDSDGNEWILHNKGVEIISQKQLVDTVAYLHWAELNNTIWLMDGIGRLGRFNRLTRKIDQIKLPSNFRNIHYMKAFGRDSLAFCSLTDGLIILDTRRLTFRQVLPEPRANGLNEVQDFFRYHGGNIWIWNSNPGIYFCQRSTGRIIHLFSPDQGRPKYPQNSKLFIREDANGTIWTVPRGGNLCYFDPQELKLKYYYSKADNPLSVISPSVRYVFSDKQKNIWIDNHQTLVKLSFFENDLHLITGQVDELEVRALMLDQRRNLWVGVKNNRLKILNSNNECLGYLGEDGTLSAKPVPFPGNVYCMLEDSDKNIWIGTRSNGLFLFKPGKSGPISFEVHHFLNRPDDLFSLSNNSVYSLYQDHLNRLWVGTFDGGINLVELKSEKVGFINQNNLWKESFPLQGKRIRCISEFDNKVMFFGSTNGLLSCSSMFGNPGEVRFYLSTRRVDDASSLTNNDVLFIHCDEDKHIFILSKNGGINEIISKKLLEDELQFKSFTEKNALLTDQTLSMIGDHKNGLWLVSDQLLSRYYPEQEKVEHVSSFMVRNNIHFSEAAPTRNSKGNLVFGTDKGILEFNPALKNERPYQPPVVFTDLLVQGKKSDIAPGYLSKLVLKPSERNLSIAYSAIDFRDPAAILYACKMEGIDKDWNYCGTNRTANYMNLAPGTYQFRVKSTNSVGVWMENERVLTVIVKPKFRETIWAWILFSIVVLLIIQMIMLILYTIYRLKYEVKMEKQLSDLKLNFFTEISHELRTPLTLISGPVDEMMESGKIPDELQKHMEHVKQNTDRLLRMVNQILDFRKVNLKKMQLLIEETDFVLFVSRIMENFQLLANNRNLLFALKKDVDELTVWIDRDKFEKIIFNLLSNAFKYTPDGKSILLTVSANESSAFLSVKDEGIGIKEGKFEVLFQRFETILNKERQSYSTGIGLSLVKEFVELHHGEIVVSSVPPAGTEFILSFPLGNKHFRNDQRVEFILGDYQGEPEVPDTMIGNNFVGKDQFLEDEKWSLLIVEDNVELRSFLVEILSDEFAVLEAENGAAGLELARTHVPDIIVSDVLMPVLDGLEMVNRIKADHELCHIPIVLLTAKGSIEDRITGIESGIDAYITKPFNARYLRSRIRKLIEQRKMLQQFYLSGIVAGSVNIRHEQLSPTEPQITSYDKLFIQKMMDFMEKNMDNSALVVDDFIEHFSMSRAVFFKKVKILLGISPVVFIREIRIKRAIQLIDSGIYSVADIAYRCGFNAPNYFAKCFKQQTGITPSEYIRDHREEEL